MNATLAALIMFHLDVVLRALPSASHLKDKPLNSGNAQYMPEYNPGERL